MYTICKDSLLGKQIMEAKINNIFKVKKVNNNTCWMIKLF